MAEQAKSTNEQNTNSEEQKKDFKSLSLTEMEVELNKVSEEVQSETDEADDSVDSEEESESTETEEVTEESETDEASKETSEEVDEESTTEDKTKSDKIDKSFDVNKAYKELQAEYTRSRQELKKLKESKDGKPTDQTKSAQSDAEKAVQKKFDQLKKNNPKATSFLDELQQAVVEVVQEQLQEKVAPIEERVTLRTRQENLDKFDRDLENFKNSDLKELEPQVLAIYNADPNYWQRLLLDSDNAFKQLLDRVILENLDTVAELKGRKKQANSAPSNKKKMLDKANVGKPSGSSKEVPTKEFKKLSLEEMENALPKAD